MPDIFDQVYSTMQKKQQPQQNDNQDIFDQVYSNMKKDQQTQQTQQNVSHQQDQQVPEGFGPGKLPTGWFPGLTQKERDVGKRGASKGIISGGTLGLSQSVEGLRPTGEEQESFKGGELVGSLAPIHKLIGWFGKPLANLASQSPIFTKQLTSLANLLGVGATGATLEAGKQTAESIREGENKFNLTDVLNHGAEWAAIDAGLGFIGKSYTFGKWLTKKAAEYGASKSDFLKEVLDKVRQSKVNINNPEKIAEKALEVLQTEFPKPKGPLQNVKQIKTATELPLQQRERLGIDLPLEAKQLAKDLKNKKLSPERFEPLEIKMVENSKPYTAGEFNEKEIINEIPEKINQELENISPRAATEQELGINVKKDIEQNLKAAKEEYTPMYTVAEEVASTGKPFNDQKTAKLAIEKLQELESLKTRPAGYNVTIKHLENIIEDLGYVIERDEAGKLSQVILGESRPVSNLMALGRRVGETINYETIEKSVRDILKPIQQSIKSGIRTGLESNPRALGLWNEAEKKFAQSAQKFGRESVRNVRQLEATEKVANLIKSPTMLEDLKKTLSDQQYRQVERELLEQMNKGTEKNAREMYREIRPHLSPESQVAAQEIISGKAKPEGATRLEKSVDKVRNAVLDDFAQSAITGGRPETALKLWKTKNGQQLVKYALKDNPNKENVLKYLQDQSLSDFSKSITKENGKIDFKKLNQLMNDPATRENIRLIGGEDAVKFFENLENLSKRVSNNIGLSEKILKRKVPKEEKIINKEQGEQKLKQYREKLEKQIEEKSTKAKEQSKVEKVAFKEKVKKPEKELTTGLEKQKVKVGAKGEEKLAQYKGKVEVAKKEVELAKNPPDTFDKFETWLKGLDQHTKVFLSASAPTSLLLTLGLPKTVSAGVMYGAIRWAAKNPVVRNAFRQAAASTTNPISLYIAIQYMNNQDKD